MYYTVIKPQAAQTLFVIYIRDSIALRVERRQSLNRQNMALERLSCQKDFKITQAQTKVSFVYLNPLLQIFEPFSLKLFKT